MSFAQDHADLLTSFDEGVAVTFTLATPGTYDATTDTWSTPTSATVAGRAYRVRGDPKVYQALELVESEAPTLLFRPTTYAEVPALNSTVSWGSVTYVVKHVQVTAPDSNAIVARVVMAR